MDVVDLLETVDSVTERFSILNDEAYIQLLKILIKYSEITWDVEMELKMKGFI